MNACCTCISNGPYSLDRSMNDLANPYFGSERLRHGPILQLFVVVCLGSIPVVTRRYQTFVPVISDSNHGTEYFEMPLNLVNSSIPLKGPLCSQYRSSSPTLFPLTKTPNGPHRSPARPRTTSQNP
jgi:hypothetical protein